MADTFKIFLTRGKNMGKKLRASEVWEFHGVRPFVKSVCEDCAKRNDLDCKFAALNKMERNAAVVSCKHKRKEVKDEEK